ncbi:MAG: phosphoheptose isomerase [Bacteroidia bacterium]
MKGLLPIQASTQDEIFEEIAETLDQQGFSMERTDFNRPWGGFFVIEEKHAPRFVSTWFPDGDFAELVGERKVSPKILVVAPEKRLSWQYHHRRSEVWRVVHGEVGVIKSDTDEQGELMRLSEGDLVVLQQGERHRLVGLEGYGLIAEIWQHTDPENPSNEEDIVRLQDDFSRK